MRIIIVIALAVLQWAVITGAIAADAYPAKALRLIVPFPPGGPADALARLVGDKLSISLGKAVVVDNRPGAGGNIGMELGAKSAPDGHTLVLAPAGNLTVNPFLYRNVPYDVGRDLAPVTVIAAVPNVLVVHPSVPAKSVAELIRSAKAHPGTLNYSSPGNGSGAHLAGELFKSMAGVDIVHIPFNGIAPAVAAVVGGQVQMMSRARHRRCRKSRQAGSSRWASRAPNALPLRWNCPRSPNRACRDSTSRPGIASWSRPARRATSSRSSAPKSPLRWRKPTYRKSSPALAPNRSAIRPRNSRR
jgi:tripartite-type tricarboxylate transporter receptor subunit TctC